MSEWIEYTGSDEQIEQMRNAEKGFAIRAIKRNKDFVNKTKLEEPLNLRVFEDVNGRITEFLICDPHQLADMICQQAKTGQPVWIKLYYEYTYEYFCEIYPSKEEDEVTHIENYTCIIKTTTPYWFLDNAEYRFTPF